MSRRSQMLRDGRVNVFLALGYLIWSLLPHAHFLVHAHGNGESAHSHASFHDQKLLTQALVTANPEDAPDAALEPETCPIAAEPGIKPLNLRHGHFSEDQNILAMGMAAPIPQTASPIPTSPAFPTLAPLLPYSGPARARGPPSSPA